MAVSDDRKYSKEYVYNLLEGVMGKTLGEVDKSHQFARTEKSEKITGIAGDVVEQSVFGYERDSRQECDIDFCEHSFLCPVFCEYDADCQDKTLFVGFKRFAFDEKFIENEVRRTWEDSRNLTHRNELEWEYQYDSNGNKRKNGSGAYIGAPNFPKSSQYLVFFRGGADVSNEKTRTECVNGIRMLPQYFWLKGSFIANKLQEIPYL
ncbi:MAG: hypothetical protein ACI3Y0_10820 [Prevotella sp.]